ncbi:MAG: hypothetical protein ABIH72_05885 [archaeon]
MFDGIIRYKKEVNGRMPAKKKSKKSATRAKKSRAAKKAAPRKLPQPVVLKKGGGDLLLAVVALILNILIPGVGSLVGGKVKAGIWQLVLTIIGAFVLIVVFYLGALIIAVAWVWALVTGIKLVIQSS